MEFELLLNLIGFRSFAMRMRAKPIALLFIGAFLSISHILNLLLTYKNLKTNLRKHGNVFHEQIVDA
jgi:hypothetical protein